LRRAVRFLAFLSLFVCVTAAFPGAAGADIFYAASNYETGSAGTLARDGGVFTVKKDLVTNLGVDAWGFTFKDHNGAERAMIREYHYAANDTVYVWDPADWKKPVVNTNSWGTNFHAAASSGRHLYLATYESYGSAPGSQEDTGEVVRVDMGAGYARDKAYQYGRFTSEAGNRVSPHAEGVYAAGDRIYVLYALSYNGVNEYEASEVVEFDRDLNVLRKVQLKNSAGETGKNAAHMAYHGGRLYVVCMGGYQGPESWGDVWEVDVSGMTARRALDGRDIPYELTDGTTAAVGMYGVQFAADGTAFLLTGSYGADMTFRARLFVTTAGRLSGGDAGSLAVKFGTKPGYSWDILWDEADSTLWCMAGTELQARGKNGGIIRTFTPGELGDNVYSVALLNGSGAPDSPDTPDNSDNPNDPDSPNDPATPDDPEIKPAKPYIPGAPDGVEGVAPSALADDAGLSRFSSRTGIPEEWMTKGASGYALDGARARDLAENLWGGVSKTEPLPAFTAGLGRAGGTAAVGFTVKGSALMANNPSEIKLMKVRGGSNAPRTFAYGADGYADGTFRLLGAGGSAHTGAISAGAEYTLVLFIKDGGEFDADRMADGNVMDPAVIVSAGDGGDAGGSAGPGGGGCDSGAPASLAALALCAALAAAKRYGGVRYEKKS
jgi:hypothetical protein